MKVTQTSEEGPPPEKPENERMKQRKLKLSDHTRRENETEKNLNEGTVMRRRRNAEREKK